MGQYCAVVGCTSDSRRLYDGQKRRFYSFPNEEARKEKWVSALKRMNSDKTKWVPENAKPMKVNQ